MIFKHNFTKSVIALRNNINLAQLIIILFNDPQIGACGQQGVHEEFPTPSRRSSRFRHATFKLVVMRLKTNFRLNVACSVCVQISAFSKKIVSAFSVNDHVAVQASLSDLLKFCNQSGNQILFVNMRINKYLLD